MPRLGACRCRLAIYQSFLKRREIIASPHPGEGEVFHTVDIEIEEVDEDDERVRHDVKKSSIKLSTKNKQAEHTPCISYGRPGQ